MSKHFITEAKRMQQLAGIKEARVVPQTVMNSKIKEAIKDIVKYATLPSQINYTKSYQIKADKAEKYLMSLPNGQKYIDQARAQIDDYYTEDPGTGRSPSDYNNAMF